MTPATHSSAIHAAASSWLSTTTSARSRDKDKTMRITRSALFLLLLGTTAVAKPEIAKPTKLALPGGEGGIGFDDMMFSPSLHRVIAPAGRTGKLDLIDPKTQKVE